MLIFIIIPLTIYSNLQYRRLQYFYVIPPAHLYFELENCMYGRELSFYMCKFHGWFQYVRFSFSHALESFVQNTVQNIAFGFGRAN